MRLSQQSLPSLLKSTGRPLLALGASGVLWFTVGCSTSDSPSGVSGSSGPVSAPVSARADSSADNVLARVDSGATVLGVIRCSTSAGDPGTEGNAASAEGEYPVVSGDGNLVAFESLASNLVPGDTNGVQDVFIRDLTNDTITRVLSSSDLGAGASQEPNAAVYKPSLSRDGRYLSFESAASNLIAGDTNGTRDIFRLDRQTGVIIRVSVYSGGGQSSTTSSQSSISGDGQRIAFISDQPLAGTPAAGGIFVRDLRPTTPTTIFCSINSNNEPLHNGTESPKISSDGGHVTFWANTDNGLPGDPVGFYQPDVYVRDLPGSTTLVGTSTVTYPTGRTIRASNNNLGQRGNDQSAHPSISEDGRYVSFWSQATNLATGAQPNKRNIYWHDNVTQKTNCCSLTSAGVPASQGDTQFSKISANGEWVAFTSQASDLNTYSPGEQVYLCNIKSAALETVLVSTNGANQPANGGTRIGGISDDGSRMVFGSIANNLVANDTNGVFDVFVKNNPVPKKKTTTIATTLVSSNSLGEQAQIGIDYYYHVSSSSDGRFVAFGSGSLNLVSGDLYGYSDIFVKDRQTGQTELVSLSSGGVQGDSGSYDPSISGDGRYVAFFSVASNLVSGVSGYQLFLRDRQNNTTTLVSSNSAGTPSDNGAFDNSISLDGRYVAFESASSILVPGDTNGAQDIFVKDTQTGGIVRASTDASGNQAYGQSYQPRFSGDGRSVGFYSYASNLAAGHATGSYPGAFVKNLQNGSIECLSAGGDNSSLEVSLSQDGRYAAFSSQATNLVTPDANGSNQDIYLKDRQAGTLQRISRSTAGVQGNSWSFSPSISSDGRYVVYSSYSNNLVSGDTNGTYDSFVFDRQLNTTVRASATAAGAQINGHSYYSIISPNGLLVLFPSYASNLGTNGSWQLFARSRP